MSNLVKNQKSILRKLGIEQLNPMQEEAALALSVSDNLVLLSPTGTGKTLAFLLPILEQLDRKLEQVQCLIIVPSRELAIQIEQVAREMGSGLKINAVYGGRHFSKDKMELKHTPAIVVGTPGRVADHLRRSTFSTKRIAHLVLDEFDKSLEVGFEDDMKEIVQALPNLKQRILTSATEGVAVPDFVKLDNPVYVNYLSEGKKTISIKRIISPDKDKLPTLVNALKHLGNQPGIVFCNFKASIDRVSEFLTDNDIPHGCFYGGMEQKDRERALIKFRNGSHQLLLATDLAARGIDVPEIQFIIHYHLPHKLEEFTHRNGRTARMHQTGTAYVLQWKDETLPEFIPESPIEEVSLDTDIELASQWDTLFISGGRKDKISKGDIAGLFFKEGKLQKEQLGVIELKQDCAFVGIQKNVSVKIAERLNNSRLKKKKVRIHKI